MKRTVSFLLFVCLLLLLIPGTALAAPTFNQAVDRLLTQHYPQRVETYLNSLGTSPLGFRLAGTPSDNAAAQYLADRWTAMGLTGVAQEAVPVDVWDVQGAWVRVGGRTLTASQFAGVPGTPADGIKGNVVYLHDGTKQDFDAAGDVTGKIVVVDTALDSYWMNMPGAEATLRGATAIVMTYGPHSGPWYYFANSLGANDGEYDRSWVPIVYVSRADGAWLKSQIAAGSVSATVTSLVTVTMHTSGGVGYNVVGQITGSDPSLPAILINSHHDAHFRPGMDDTGAVATQMTIAKAMKMSGYKPRRTVIFLSTTGEEFGYTDSWYDWSIGAWYAVTNTHAADWPGKLAAMINLELMARKGDPLKVSASTDLSGWVAASAKANSSLLPWGYRVEWPMDTWQDRDEQLRVRPHLPHDARERVDRGLGVCRQGRQVHENTRAQAGRRVAAVQPQRARRGPEIDDLRGGADCRRRRRDHHRQPAVGEARLLRRRCRLSGAQAAHPVRPSRRRQCRTAGRREAVEHDADRPRRLGLLGLPASAGALGHRVP
jgi:hypothetical protein